MLSSLSKRSQTKVIDWFGIGRSSFLQILIFSELPLVQKGAIIVSEIGQKTSFTVAAALSTFKPSGICPMFLAADMSKSMH